MERETDSDTWLYQVTAKRGGLQAGAHGYTEKTAKLRAVAKLIELEKNLSPITPNWENTSIAMMMPTSAEKVGFNW